MSTDPRTLWREQITDGEEARFERYGEELLALRRAAARDEPLGRALHTKAHVTAEGTFEVLPTVPEELKVSLFASPCTKRACVRFSNGIGRRQGDGMPDLRGLAVKVLDVPGRKLLPGLEQATTQDFLLVTVASVAFRDAEEFLAFMRADAGGPLLLLPRLLGALGVGRALKVLGRLAKMPQPRSLATARFYTAAPTKLGPFAAKFSLAPVASPGERRGRGAHMHREDLVARLKEGDLVYTFRAQLFQDEATTPLEDLTVEWPEAVSPWVDLARLTVLKVDVEGPEGRAAAERIEAMSFDPWHATEDLRPLGEIMRARRVAYKHSAIARGATPEP
ncbi:MAG: hypothetical protein HY909_06595 [Deltaproteobacteria bacterium]|nr:hypothetical protein [Deltaproteobacteria bacterium]